MDQNLAENKAQMKSSYDRRHNVVKPQCSVGDKVLILGKKVPVGSPSVLTYPQYHGPYYISDVIQRGSIGTAYRLINVDTGKVVKNLIGTEGLRSTLQMIEVRFRRGCQVWLKTHNRRLPSQ